MSEVHDQALHLLTVPQIGTFLTPEGREMVLRALGEVDTLRQRAEKAEAQLADAVAHAKRAQTKLGELREMLADEMADSPAAPKRGVEVPSATPLPTEPAGDVVPPRPLDSGPAATPGSPRQGEQVAADAAREADDANPARAEQRERALDGPEVAAGGAERQPTPQNPAATETAAKWGRADGKGAFHLWREGFSESECAEEVCDGEVLLGDPIPDNTCLSCAAIAGWDVPEGLSKPDDQPELPTIKRTCAGFNKSATVPCGSPNVSVAYNGKWFCRRHDPTKPKVCLMAGCGRAGRTAKGSPGIWCKEHGEKLSAEERTAIARVANRLEAANG